MGENRRVLSVSGGEGHQIHRFAPEVVGLVTLGGATHRLGGCVGEIFGRDVEEDAYALVEAEAGATTRGKDPGRVR